MRYHRVRNCSRGGQEEELPLPNIALPNNTNNKDGRQSDVGPMEVMSGLLPARPIFSLPAPTAGDGDSDDDQPLSFKRVTKAETSRGR